MKRFIQILIVAAIFLGCNKENADVVRVQVLNKKVPVSGHWVNFSAGGSSIGDYTNADGIATIDLNGLVIDFPEDYLFFSIKPSGYTRFVNKETLHTIETEDEEVIEVKVLAPDLENSRYNIGDKVDIKLQVTSNLLPLVFRSLIIAPLNSSIQPIEYSMDNFGDNNTQPDYDGILNFTYTVHEDGDSPENTNGFSLNIPDEGFSYLEYTFSIHKN